MTAGLDPLHIVQGEIYVVVSHMRRNARWASLHNQGEEDPLLQGFKKLKQTMATATRMWTRHACFGKQEVSLLADLWGAVCHQALVSCGLVLKSADDHI